MFLWGFTCTLQCNWTENLKIENQMKELDCQALNYELMKNKIKFRVADTQSDMANERLRREKKTS